MLFIYQFDFTFNLCHFEHSNLCWRDELHGNRAAYQLRELCRTASDILTGLHDSMLVTTTLRLNRNDILASVLVNTDIDFIDLNLPDVLYCRTKVVLERECGNTEKYVNKAVVPYLCEKCLFVTKRIVPDYLRCCVRDLDGDQILSGQDAVEWDKTESVQSSTRALNYSFISVWLGLRY